ncbi:hypothetical protein FERRO_10900 [Ferrovum sp. JA12]|jgi:hypothetical protein|uniref:hypothetical protein n=1 Tax=Ferrovum sp. JA12 TaxID=1356299 RepID=UPI000712E64B|nr:hypothetical protein [Ferrovum sp. JA12]KRH78110.1 hypothetical protein FERRO_10900 [Ferrovum sp. JA12]HQT81223.1 hypothetical protein [Ferrovaceae bacterium]HQU05676.1 hypothetical protein [Ferrovaceae bacterium]
MTRARELRASWLQYKLLAKKEKNFYIKFMSHIKQFVLFFFSVGGNLRLPLLRSAR